MRARTNPPGARRLRSAALPKSPQATSASLGSTGASVLGGENTASSCGRSAFSGRDIGAEVSQSSPAAQSLMSRRTLGYEAKWRRRVGSPANSHCSRPSSRNSTDSAGRSMIFGQGVDIGAGATSARCEEDGSHGAIAQSLKELDAINGDVFDVCVPVIFVNGDTLSIKVNSSTLVHAVIEEVYALHKSPCSIMLGPCQLQPQAKLVDVLHEHGVAIEDLVFTAWVMTPTQLKDIGYTAFQLVTDKLSYPLESLREAGYTALELSKAHYEVSANAFRKAGYTASNLKAARYPVKELAVAGYTLGELKVGGFTLWELHQVCGSPLKLKEAGCTAPEPKSFGYSLRDLRDVFDVMELKGAGYNAKDFNNVGFTLRQLKDVGFTAREIARAGYSAQRLMSAAYTLGEIQEAGYTGQQLKKSGCTAWEIAAITRQSHL